MTHITRVCRSNSTCDLYGIFLSKNLSIKINNNMEVKVEIDIQQIETKITIKVRIIPQCQDQQQL